MASLVRHGLRRRVAALAGVALVIALGLGAALASFSTAWRTHAAYPDYLDRADVSEVVLNPSLLTDRIQSVIASTPGVLRSATDALFLATPDEGDPRPLREVEGETTHFRSSRDGRYVRQDRPVVHRGRVLGGGNEAFLSLDAAEALGLDVGDELPVAFWQAMPSGADLTQVVVPIGRTRAKVVGVGVLPDEVLPDELYPRKRVLLSPDVTERFDCISAHPPPDDSLTLDQLVARFFPEGCARGPSSVALMVAGGDRGVSGVVGAISERVDHENNRLPKVMRDLELGFTVMPTATAEHLADVRRSLTPTVTALQLLGAVAAASTVAVVGLGALRSLRRIEPETQVWSDIGMTRGQRAAAAGLPLAVAAAFGLVGAVLVAWVASGIGPVGSARFVDPKPSRGLPLVVGAVTIGFALALAAPLAAASWLTTRPGPSDARTAASWTGKLVARGGNVPLILGVQAAMPATHGSRAGARALLGGAVTAVTAVVAAVVFSWNLKELVENPERFGWPFDAAAVVNFGYGGVDEQVLSSALDREDVEHWGVAALPSDITVNGETVPALAGRTGFDHFPVPLISGRYPSGVDEIALGTRSADRLEVSPGDQVAVSTPYGERQATVSGLVVLPPIGPFLADRAGLGTGTLLSSRLLEALVAGAEGERGLEPGELSATLGTFIGIDLHDRVDPARFAQEIRPEVRTWDVNGFPGLTFGEPVRPPEIADVAAMRSAPTALALMLAVTMSVALALALALSARSRRRELAILHALGCTSRQLRSSVRWHALTVVAFGLSIGVLLGMSLASFLWSAFTEGLGSESFVAWPVHWMVLVVLGASGVAIVAGSVPARMAVRLASADRLRDE